MALVVFDASVVIAFLASDDIHHRTAVDVMHASLEPGVERWLSAVTLTEILVGPTRLGREATVENLLDRLSIEIRPVDSSLARRAARVRALTTLALPDAYVAALGMQALDAGVVDVRLESFDRRLLEAYAGLSAE